MIASDSHPAIQIFSGRPEIRKIATPGHGFRRKGPLLSLAPGLKEGGMTNIDRKGSKMVLTSGSTTLTLDKDAGTVNMQRKLMFWNLKPMQAKLDDVTEIAVDAGVDRASGIDVCNAMVVLRDGAAWALPTADKKDAQKVAQEMRDFLGLKA